ncbi:MAG TPA: hypothetical protein VK501_08230 [Baekduia sp.]|uniref:hypothetical protein n=1 Tax=Baekduia sp. TaxID=2600305 RepID=UPI002CC1D0F5|nr:hypothetical protein [Baekduia sp.]HMJ33890.1 hypothetical protein [Baekduia sp.]
MRDERAGQARLRSAVDAAQTAAADAFLETIDGMRAADQELRWVIAVTRGDPAVERTQTEAVFFAIDDHLPIESSHRNAMALATLKAGAPEIYDRVREGLVAAEILERLQDEADHGDAGAAEKLRLLTARHTVSPTRRTNHVVPERTQPHPCAKDVN